eukprot:scaffold11518_cov30-Prasinocladus_malaysianus.AAC.1
MAAVLSSSATLAARPSLALKRAPRATRAAARAPVAVRAQKTEKAAAAAAISAAAVAVAPAAQAAQEAFEVANVSFFPGLCVPMFILLSSGGSEDSTEVRGICSAPVAHFNPDAWASVKLEVNLHNTNDNKSGHYVYTWYLVSCHDLQPLSGCKMELKRVVVVPLQDPFGTAYG